MFIFGILAVARAGDAWSVDAWNRGKPRAPRREYTWPIRLVWVSMSLVLFAAGLSKLRHGGLEWAFSENMAIMLTKAQYHGSDADPLVDWCLWIAASPVLSQVLAFVSLGIEILFPLALFSRRARVVLVPGAFGMLVGIRVLMGPTFGGFLTAFAFWVPWKAVTDRVRALARPGERYAMLFDGSCGFCARTMAVVRRLDVLGRIDVLDAAGQWSAIAERYPELSQAACLEDMHVVGPSGRVFDGYAAYRALAWAIPAAWPLLPLLYLPGAHWIGQRVYRAVARHRLRTACAIDGAGAPRPHEFTGRR